MGDLSKDTTEMDLWDFDDLDSPSSTPSLPEKRQTKPTAKLVDDDLDPPSASPQTSRPEPSSPKPRQIRTSPVQRNLPGKGNPRTPSAEPDPTPIQVSKKVEDDFDDLEHWDDLPDIRPAAKPVKKASPKTAAPAKSQPAPETPEESFADDVDEITTPSNANTSSPATDSLFDEGLSPTLRSDLSPVSLRPRLGLNKSERIGLITLVMMLVVGGVFFLNQSINRLPTEAERIRSQDFPVKGTRIQVDTAATFWREPGGSDVVRRGTALVPAAEISVSGGTGAIRIFFLNDRGERVGDPINREVSGTTKISFSATAGFEDLSMHAAYRTGETKPWSILVLEGESTNASGESFKKLFEMSISTDRR
jgi:hypothetical protein